jgi:hypothetical protein
MDKFITWLKQPSSIKAIVLFVGLAGVTIAPERLEEIVGAAIIIYGGISALWDKN